MEKEMRMCYCSIAKDVTSSSSFCASGPRQAGRRAREWLIDFITMVLW